MEKGSYGFIESDISSLYYSLYIQTIILSHRFIVLIKIVQSKGHLLEFEIVNVQ